MKFILRLTSLGEAAFGALVLIYPPTALRALFGVEIVEIDRIGVIMSRIAGVALIGLGVACWPGYSVRQQLYGMLTYSILVMLYLIRIGVRGAPVGMLLRPAVILHAGLVVLLVWMWRKQRQARPE